MFFPIRPILYFGLALGLISPARSQSPAPGAAADDADWQRLKQFEKGSPATTKTGSRAAVRAGGKAGSAPAIALSPLAADYLARADQLRDFRTAHSGDARDSEAKRLEALMLLNAQLYSAEIDTDRCDLLVTQAREDLALPAEARFALASLADHHPLRFGSFASEQARLARFETTARALIAEFPEVPQAYEGFLNLAKSCPDEQAARIARDLLKLDSPPPIKDAAQTLRDRCALVGEPLKNVLSAALSAKAMPALAKNRVIILYGWSADNEGGFIIAQEIAAQAPAGATVLGINLDTDTAAARKAATARSLPGIQLYDPAGPDSKLARALKLNRDVVVIIANRQGNISTVSGQLNLADKISAANQ